jgi:hypothetical protein
MPKVVPFPSSLVVGKAMTVKNSDKSWHVRCLLHGPSRLTKRHAIEAWSREIEAIGKERKS